MAKILTATIHVRVTPEEKEKFQAAADSAAQSLGEWVRKALLIAAQPAKPSEPGEGVLRMENGKHLPVLPVELPSVELPSVEISSGVSIPFESATDRMVDPAVIRIATVTAPPPPPTPVDVPVAVVTAAPAKMSMVDRMYAIIEARDGKEKADFWLLTSAGKRK